MPRTILSLAVASAVLALAPLSFASVPSGATAATVSPNQADIQQAEQQQAAADNALYQAAQSYVSSKEQQQTSKDLSGISADTTSAGNILPPVSNSWYNQYLSNTAQANYWQGQIWQEYSYSCGTAKDPQSCIGWYYDSSAASDYSYYSGLASTDYQHYQEDEEQHAMMNGAASAQSGMSATAATQSAADLAQAKAQQSQAEQLGNQSGASVGAAYAGVNGGATASGNQAADSAISQINQKYGYTPPAAAPSLPTLSDGINGQAIVDSAPGASRMVALEADNQTLENNQEQEYVAQQQAQAAQTKDQQQASALEAKAAMAPTAHSREAWQEAADAAQAKASQEGQAAQAAINQQNTDQQQERQNRTQAVNLADSASGAANASAIQQGDSWAQRQIQQINAEMSKP